MCSRSSTKAIWADETVGDDHDGWTKYRRWVEGEGKYGKDGRDVLIWHIVLYGVGLAMILILRYMGTH